MNSYPTRLNFSLRYRWRLLLCLAAALVLQPAAVVDAATTASACPFCSSVNLTFTDQIAAKDVVVSAKLLKLPPLSEDPEDDLPRATFEITKVLKGDEVLEAGMEFQALLIGRYKPGKEFLVMGVDPPDIAWTTPIKASPVLLQYLEDIQSLPEKGPQRLLFFQKYFENDVTAIAFDAYDEFAKAPYSDLVAIKDQMERPQLLKWIQSPDTSINRRRLYLTMLGVCGTDADADVLEKMISDGGDQNLRGMDALVACYLCLKGDAGVDLIEKKFLLDDDCEFTTTMGAVSALRFHGTEVDIVSKERIIAAVRKLLDRPKMADLIISDLARWEDWSATDKLVQMFKESKEDNRWLRVPIVSFLMESPEPRAKVFLKELKEIDPAAIERAALFGRGFDDDEEDDSDAERVETEETSNAHVELPAAVSLVSADRYTTRKVPLDGLDGGAELTAGGSSTSSRAEATPVADNRQPTLSVASTAPVATVVPYLTLKIILIPFVCSVVLFFLLWSVVSGSFQRLIF